MNETARPARPERDAPAHAPTARCAADPPRCASPKPLAWRAFAPTLAILVAGSALQVSARAQIPTVHVDIDRAGVATASASEAGAAGAPGLWNAVDVSLATGSVLASGPLADTAGQPTGITLTAVAEPGAQFRSAYQPVGGLPPRPTNDLLSDVCYVQGVCTWVFGGVPAGDYDVYTYAMAPEGLPNLTAVSVAGALQGTEIVGGTYSGAYAEGLTHALHRVTVEPLGGGSGAGAIVVQTEPYVGYDSVAGFQLVPAGAGGPIGTPFCPGAQNSTGLGGAIDAIGQTALALDDLALRARNLPPQTITMFVVSMDEVAPVATGQGWICLGGGVGRFDRPGEVGLSDPFGSFGIEVDLGDVPGVVGGAAAAVGDTLCFQAWHRDEVGGVPTWNFTGGVKVVLD